MGCVTAGDILGDRDKQSPCCQRVYVLRAHCIVAIF